MCNLFAQCVEDARLHPHLVQADHNALAVQQTNHDFSPLLVGSTETRKSTRSAHDYGDFAVLRDAPLGDVQIGHDFQTRNDGRVHFGRSLQSPRRGLPSMR